MAAVDFLPLGSVADEGIRCAVIVARYRGKLLFVRRCDRATLELPGGGREPGEAPLVTARRELYEETGAVQFDLAPICISSTELANGRRTFGLLCRADVYELGPLPATEIAEVVQLEECPDVLTYPEIHPRLIERAGAENAAK